MIKYFQFLFAAVFTFLLLFIFITSYFVLTSDTKISNDLPKLPQPPATINIEQIDTNLTQQVQEEQLKLHKNKLDLYSQQVTAYAQEINAYKSFIENQQTTTEGNQKLQLYNSVIKDNLVSLLSTLISGIIAYVFATKGLEVYKSYLDKKANINK